MTDLAVTQDDDGKTVDLAEGDTLTVHLPENPTTGYRWTLDQHDASALVPSDKPIFQSAGPAIGASGGRVFSFRASTPGQQVLELSLRRAWEGQDSAQKTFRVNVQIHK